MKLMFIIPVFFCCSVIGQIKLDSLKSIWHNTEEKDSVRLSALHDIAWKGFVFSNPDSALFYADIQLNLAKRVNSKYWMAYALNTKGVAHIILGKYPTAFKEHMEALKLRQAINHKAGIAMSLTNIGNTYHYQGDYSNAIMYFTKALKIDESIENWPNIILERNNIALIYMEQNMYDEAIKELNEARIIASGLQDINNLVMIDMNIGKCFFDKGSYEESLIKYEEALENLKNTGNKYYEASTYTNIGNAYAQLGDQNKALEYHFKSYELFKEMDMARGYSASLNNIGGTYLNMGKPDLAVQYSTKAFEHSQKTGDKTEIKDAAETLFMIYQKIGNYRMALEMLELFQSLQDSLESEENQKEVIRQEYKYRYEKQAAADSVKTAEEKKVKDAQIAQQDAEIHAKQNQQYMLFGGLGLVLIFAGFMYNRFKVTQKQKGIIEEQKHIVEEKNKEITDSINYAKRIQTAILPPDKVVKEYLENSFILYKPKDIVAGDFYWMETITGQGTGDKGQGIDTILFAACDCTGHGVPGAMVSVVCNNGLNRAVREYGLTDPGKILDKTREIVIQEFEKSEEEVKDGMDVSLMNIEILNNEIVKLRWAGANNPLWLLRNGELIEYKANKQPIGKYSNPTPFTTHEIELQKGDTLYIFTDGLQDQFGGEKGKKLKTKAFKELLLSIQDKNMSEQRNIIDETFETWKGNIEQNDDVCVIGVRV